MTRPCFAAIGLLLAFCFPLPAPCQPTPPAAEESGADRAYTAADWRSAETAYAVLTREHPENARYWYRLGVSQKSLGEFDEALASFAKAETLGVPRFLAQYALAATKAKKGDTDAAFRHLDEAVAAGFAQPDQLASDLDFASLRSDPRFAKLMEQARRAQAPCKYAPEHRQFDFWIGDWSVVSAKTNLPAGDSHIELGLGDCVILENWTSKNSGYAGKSYNVYNTVEKRWEQFWVDNAAGMIHFTGGLKDGVMDFYTADETQPEGTTPIRHLRFFPLGPDKVRQYSQGSTDHGKTWTDEYDLIYTRKKL